MEALYTATTSALKISIYQDLEPINPMGYFDCVPPAVWAFYSYRCSAELQGDTALMDVPAFPDGFIPGNLARLADITDLDFSFDGLRTLAEDAGQMLVDVVSEAITEAVADMCTPDRMDALASIYRLMGIPALATCSNGACQGDYADLLLVATPEWQEKTGAGRNFDLSGPERLLRQWHTGDSYGAVIENRCACCGQPSSVDESCWGFYGEFETSGLFDFIKEAAGQEGLDAIKEAIQ